MSDQGGVWLSGLLVSEEKVGEDGRPRCVGVKGVDLLFVVCFRAFAVLSVSSNPVSSSLP